MKDLSIIQETMSSIEIAELTGKRHSDILEAIRVMEPAWEKVNGRKFPLVEYTDKKGEKRPCYELSKTECLYVATKFNHEARAKLALRWEQLETEKQSVFRVPGSFKEALLLAASQQEQIEKQQIPIKTEMKTMEVGSEVSYPIEKMDTVKVYASNLKRKKLGYYITRTKNNEIIVKRYTEDEYNRIKSNN